MTISNHVDITITADAVNVSRAGFGIPGVLSYTTLFPERVRFYTRPSDLVADGFATDSPEYIAINAMSSQSPKPATMAVLRGALPPTITYSVEAPSALNSTTYQLRARGEGFTTEVVEYESDSAATIGEIHVGLVDALNAVTSKTYTAALEALTFDDKTVASVTAGTDTLEITGHGLITGDGPVRAETTDTLPAGLALATNYYVIRVDANNIKLATSRANAFAGTVIDITDTGTGTHTIVDTASSVSVAEAFTVTGNAAGNWFTIEVVNPSHLSAYTTHADPGVATDLSAIALENDTWFWLVTLYNSEAYIAAASSWVQGTTKFYVAGSSDTRDLGTSTGTAGALDVLKATARNQTAGFYHHVPGEFADAALVGNLAPRTTGSWTAKFKRLTGVTATPLTATQRANLVTRHANFYETVAGVSIVSNGTTAAGPSVIRGFIDDVVNIFWVEDDMAAGIFGAMAGAAKIPRTNAGMVTIESQVRATLERAISRTIAKDDPAPVIEVPDIADMADLLPRGVRIAFSFSLAGAIHEAKPVTGVVIL